MLAKIAFVFVMLSTVEHNKEKTPIGDILK